MWNLVNLQVERHYSEVNSKPNKAPHWILTSKKNSKWLKFLKQSDMHMEVSHIQNSHIWSVSHQRNSGGHIGQGCALKILAHEGSCHSDMPQAINHVLSIHRGHVCVWPQCDFVATTCVPATRPCHMSHTGENTILSLQHVAGTCPCVMTLRVHEP